MIRILMLVAVGVSLGVARGQLLDDRSLLGQNHYLPGEVEIISASARPAERVYCLIFAAAIDQYVSENRDIVSRDPVLAQKCEDAKARALLAFFEYEDQYPSFPPIVDAKREFAAVSAFLKSGYSGSLMKELKGQAVYLNKKAWPTRRYRQPR